MRRMLVSVVILIAVARSIPAATCSTTTFIRAQQFATAPAPRIALTADFNHDGLPDLATASANGQVSVLLNDGAGGFLPPLNTSFVGDIGFAVAGLFDGDLNPDLALSLNGYVLILLGNGDGTFDVGDSYPTDYATTGMVSADFDHDGTTDIAVTPQYGSKIYVLLGNGDGTFAAPIISTPATQIGYLAAADFDGDDFPDLASSSNSGSVTISPGLGDGTFGPPSNLKIGLNLGPIIAADLDIDGAADIAVTTDTYVAIARGNGDGTFQAAIDYSVGYFSNALTAADIDGDGRLDVAALRELSYNYGAGAVSVLHQLPNGFFEDGASYDVGPSAQSLTGADFDGDGEADLASTNPGFASVSVLYSIGGGNLRATTRVPIPGNAAALAIDRFTADARPDIAVLSPGAYAISILERGADDRFHQLATTLIAGSPFSMAAGQFNDDAYADVAISDYYQGFAVLLGRGDGTFDPPVYSETPFNASFIAVTDFNVDGIPDLAIVETQNPQPAGQVHIFFGAGAGVFTSGPSAALVFPASSLLAADVDGDGSPDLVTTNGPYANSISVFLGFRNGLFPPTQYPTGPDPLSAAVGQFGSISRTDLVVANGNAASVSLLPGDGFGGFGPPILVGIGYTPGTVVAADFDGDSHLDFATANTSTSNVSLLLGNGNDTFQSPQTYPVEQNPVPMAVGNLGGSAPDLVVGNYYYSNALSILVNAGLSGYLTTPPPTLVNTPISVGVNASGYGPLTYQWRQGGLPIADGGRYSGTTTPVLTIAPVTFPDTLADYSVVLTDSCTSLVIDVPPLPVEFADVPASSIFHDDIGTIAAAGVTAGCGGSNYCPDAFVSRAQMAVFLLKSEHGGSYVPPACTGLFADVPCPSFYADWIEQLSNEEVTAGCGGPDYCPDASVTRAQMAVFLLKTVGGPGYVPPPPTAIFGDVPVDAFAAAYIDALYLDGIAGGCSASPLLFCPGNPVTRAQMAAFLVNAFPLL